MSFAATSFGHTRQSSDTINWRKSPHCTDSRVNMYKLLLHIDVFEKFTLPFLQSLKRFAKNMQCNNFLLQFG
jgi:hypothetical protein